MDAAEIIEAIRVAMDSPSAAKDWIRNFISGLDPGDLVGAAQAGYDPVSDLFLRYKLLDPSVRPFATLLVRTYWRQIRRELGDVSRVVRLLLKNPKNAEALRRPEVLKWLNTTCNRALFLLYEYAWPPEVDLVCAHCGAKFQYDVSLLRRFDLRGSKRRRVVECPNCHKEVLARF